MDGGEIERDDGLPAALETGLKIVQQRQMQACAIDDFIVSFVFLLAG